MKNVYCYLLGVLLFCFGCTSQDNPQAEATDKADQPPQNITELKAEIRKLVEEAELPAVAIAMVNEKGPVWVEAIGLANLETKTRVDEHTLFRIGSVSKMFVSLAVLKLVEEGKLSLQDRLVDHAPEVEFSNPWEATDPIRIVHLLEHTTGWDDMHLPEYAHSDPTPVTLKQGLDFHPHSRRSRWVPGTRMSYTNSGPPVAAYVVEKVTGMDFEDYVTRHLFEPIGMSSATYRLDDEFRHKGATLYTDNQVEEYWHILLRPSGSINASAQDMARFLMFYLKRGEMEGKQLLSPASLARMERVESTSAARAGQQSGYGLGNFSFAIKQRLYHGHNGGLPGGFAFFLYSLETKSGHAIMINSDDGQTLGKITRLIREFETKDLPEKKIAKEIDIDPTFKSIEGFYYPINPRMHMIRINELLLKIIQLRFEEDKLVRSRLFGKSGPKYYPVSQKLYKSDKTGQISLSVVDDPLDGRVIHVDTTVYKPISAATVYAQLVLFTIWGILTIATLLYLPVWGIRKLRGAAIGAASLRLRLWPLLATLSLTLFASLMTIGAADPFALLGEPGFVSVGIMLSSLAFLIFALIGVYAVIRAKSTAMNQVNYWYCCLASTTNLLVALYSGWFGVIGMMTWS